MLTLPLCFFFYFFNDTATTEIYTLSLHDALPISKTCSIAGASLRARAPRTERVIGGVRQVKRDRKSTRLNSSHQIISYAVFCLKKKKKKKTCIHGQTYQPPCARQASHNVAHSTRH